MLQALVDVVDEARAEVARVGGVGLRALRRRDDARRVGAVVGVAGRAVGDGVAVATAVAIVVLEEITTAGATCATTVGAMVAVGAGADVAIAGGSGVGDAATDAVPTMGTAGCCPSDRTTPAGVAVGAGRFK